MDIRSPNYQSQVVALADDHAHGHYSVGVRSSTHSLPNVRPDVESLRNMHIESDSISGIFDDGPSTRTSSDGKIVKDVEETRLVIGLDYGTTYTGELITQRSDHAYSGTQELPTPLQWERNANLTRSKSRSTGAHQPKKKFRV